MLGDRFFGRSSTHAVKTGMWACEQGKQSDPVTHPLGMSSALTCVYDSGPRLHIHTGCSFFRS